MIYTKGESLISNLNTELRSELKNSADFSIKNVHNFLNFLENLIYFLNNIFQMQLKALLEKKEYIKLLILDLKSMFKRRTIGLKEKEMHPLLSDLSKVCL